MRIQVDTETEDSNPAHGVVTGHRIAEVFMTPRGDITKVIMIGLVKVMNGMVMGALETIFLAMSRVTIILRAQYRTLV